MLNPFKAYREHKEAMREIHKLSVLEKAWKDYYLTQSPKGIITRVDKTNIEMNIRRGVPLPISQSIVKAIIKDKEMKKTIAQQLNIKEFPFEIRDKNDCLIYYEDSKSYWWKREYNSFGIQTYYEDSNGVIVNNRPATVELTLDEVATKFGIDVKNLKIKK